MSPVLTIEQLSVRLPAGADRTYAVENVSVDVAPGEVVCLVGESGSGKSVTAQAVMGLLPRGQLQPTDGLIKLKGEDLLRAPARRLRALRGTAMAMVYQEPMTALNPVLPCGYQIDEVLRTHTGLGTDDRAERVRDMLDQVGLAEPERMAESYPHELSGGQRQRIMIAMALVLEPALLIADEPTTALDVTTQVQILALLRELQAAHGTGVLFITHDFGVVAEIADRVVVMRAGRVVEAGTVRDILDRPQHAYTQALIRAVPSLIPRPARAGSGRTVLEVASLAKSYRQGGWLDRRRVVDAVKDASFEIAAGEVLGLVGESGSGKSTTARCIARLEDPSAGRIRLRGAEIGSLSRRALRPHRRHVQIVFQDPYRSLNPRRRVAASLIEGPMNFGVSRAVALERARELLAFVGVDPVSIERYPHQFSGGQRQRICIARALIMEPALLIADEPVSALDVSVQAQVLELLDQVRTRLDLAVLFITHDLRVAAQICDRVLVMRRGEVVESGPTAAVFAAPEDSYTRTLVAAAPGRNWDFAHA